MGLEMYAEGLRRLREANSGATEARQLARRMGVAYVCYSFNGTSVSVGQNAEIDYINDQYLDNKKHIVSA